jgi:hypothetical protein
MAKRLSYQDAVHRFLRKGERRREQKEQKAAEHRQRKRERRRQREDADRLVKISHLRQKLRDAARYPSVLTARQLRAIATNSELPAEARVEAARILAQWLFAEPEALDPDPEVRNAYRRSTRRRD